MTENLTILSERDEDETRALLVGRRIVAAETGSWETPRRYDHATGRLTLDDGTRILVVPNQGGCACSAGDYDLAHLATVDNIITDVRLADERPETEWFSDRHAYRVYVVADAVEVNVLSVEGDDGSGYYGTGYELFVIPGATA